MSIRNLIQQGLASLAGARAAARALMHELGGVSRGAEFDRAAAGAGPRPSCSVCERRLSPGQRLCPPCALAGAARPAARA